MQPGAVSSGALDAPLSDSLPDDPYAPLFAQGANGRDRSISPGEVAAAIADAVQADPLPLRIPIGAAAVELLAARRAVPDTVPYLPMTLDW